MKKLIILILVLFPLTLRAQVGLKGGINFANITKVSSINNTSKYRLCFRLVLWLPSQEVSLAFNQK